MQQYVTIRTVRPYVRVISLWGSRTFARINNQHNVASCCVLLRLVFINLTDPLHYITLHYITHVFVKAHIAKAQVSQLGPYSKRRGLKQHTSVD